MGDFIKNCLKGDIPEAARTILEMNIIDEENHDRALGYAARAIGVDQSAEKEASLLTKAWKSIRTTPYAKQWYLERSIFFVLLPFFRFCGDAGLRSVSQDIQEMNKFMLPRTHSCVLNWV